MDQLPEGFVPVAVNSRPGGAGTEAVSLTLLLCS